MGSILGTIIQRNCLCTQHKQEDILHCGEPCAPGYNVQGNIPGVQCPGGTFCKGRHPALRHRNHTIRLVLFPDPPEDLVSRLLLDHSRKISKASTNFLIVPPLKPNYNTIYIRTTSALIIVIQAFEIYICFPPKWSKIWLIQILHTTFVF